jgi:hypothetical protein
MPAVCADCHAPKDFIPQPSLGFSQPQLALTNGSGAAAQRKCCRDTDLVAMTLKQSTPSNARACSRVPGYWSSFDLTAARCWNGVKEGFEPTATFFASLCHTGQTCANQLQICTWTRMHPAHEARACAGTRITLGAHPHSRIAAWNACAASCSFSAIPLT